MGDQKFREARKLTTTIELSTFFQQSGSSGATLSRQLRTAGGKKTAMSILVNFQQPNVPVPCVLYVDDEPGNLQAFMASFRKNFKVLLATTAQEAMDLLSSNDVHVVMADQRMPGTLGTELLRLVKERYPKVKRMLVTAYGDIHAVIEAINQGGVMGYISKPWQAEAVVGAVQKAFYEVRLERDKEDHVTRLSEANAQLEFALRQALLS